MFYIQTGNLAVDLIFNILILVLGTAILVKGSDLFIDSASGVARSWGVSELVIGLTLVSIGTSLPELASSVYAAFRGQGDFIIGNIVGSNVTNISLILGIGIVGVPEMSFERKMFCRDGFVMLLVYLVCAILFAIPIQSTSAGIRRGIDFRGGIVLLALGAGYLYLLFRQSAEESGEEPMKKTDHSILVNLGMLLLGIVMITAGAKGMVDPVIWGMKRLGISMIVISSTIVAFGTSVPELAVTIAGVVKNHHDIALGNIFGSCIFNILLIFGVTACIHPLMLKSDAASIFNLAWMGITGTMLILFMLAGKTSLTRRKGMLLLLLYAVFILYNTLMAMQ